MKLTKLFGPDDISANLESADKLGVLKELVQLLSRQKQDLPQDEVLRVLLEREKLGSTGTGFGVAIPHGKVDSLSELMVCFGRSKAGIDFDSMDGKPAHLLFLLIAPAESIGTHLSVLARISNLLNDQDIRDQLLNAGNADSIYSIIVAFENDDKLGE